MLPPVAHREPFGNFEGSVILRLILLTGVGGCDNYTITLPCISKCAYSFGIGRGALQETSVLMDSEAMESVRVGPREVAAHIRQEHSTAIHTYYPGEENGSVHVLYLPTYLLWHCSIW